MYFFPAKSTHCCLLCGKTKKKHRQQFCERCQDELKKDENYQPRTWLDDEVKEICREELNQ
jgi:hypothetical protein